MKVVVARTAGFCRGVRDALDLTLEAIKRIQDGEKICTFGPLIHNRQVLAMLEEKGIQAEEKIENCAGKKVVIRAHGIPPQDRKKLQSLGATLLDATCRRVAKVQAAIKRHARKGYHTVIVGDADHAEVIGLMGYAEGRGVVIHRPQQVQELPDHWERVLLVAQTTQNEEVFLAIQQEFEKKYPQAVVRNTICGSTHERQKEVRELCAQVDAMVIVGGHHSGNTVRLAEVARGCSVPTYHIETENELDAHQMRRYSSVGVSAGASTPNWMIRNVVRFLESIEPEEADIKFKVRRIVEQLVYSNVFVAAAAALLTFAGQALAMSAASFKLSIMAAFYIFAMHTLNLYLDEDSVRFNDPHRAAFYQKWRAVFMGTSFSAVLISLWIALTTSPLTFIAMIALVLLGILYAVPLFLPSRWQSLPALKIKDIPASKTLFVPIAWASCSVLLPHLNELEFGHLFYAFWVIALLVFVRTALLDLLAVQGDRLVGKETVVVLLGETKTARLMTGVLILLGILAVLGPLMEISHGFAYFVLPTVILYGFCFRVSSRKPLKEGALFEAFIESILIAFGLVGMMWSLVWQ